MWNVRNFCPKESPKKTVRSSSKGIVLVTGAVGTKATAAMNCKSDWKANHK